MIEVLGYIASFLIVFAFVFNDERMIRKVNILGAFLLGLYGLITGGIPVVIANWCLVALNLYKIFKKEVVDEN